MTTDYVSGELTDETQQKVLRLLREALGLMPFLRDLSPEDKAGLPRMGDKSRAFVEQALVAATQHQDLLPKNFDLEEFRRDVELGRKLGPVLAEYERSLELGRNTYTGVNADCYSRALLVYQVLKLNGEGAALENHLDALGRRFARRSPAKQDQKPG
jgi:hypothetical protein